MEQRSLILGGTKGLGYSIAKESAGRNVSPVIVGRSVEEGYKDPNIPSAIFWKADLSNLEGVNTVLDYYHSVTGINFIFWVAGIFLRKRLLDCGLDEIRRMFDTHLYGPVCLLTALHRMRSRENPLSYFPGYPYHLVVIASTSSWRVRDNETLYCAVKAAKAHFAGNFARELVRDLPGSKLTLVNPGGIKTNLFHGTGQDISNFMEPDEVAKIVWDEVLGQKEDFDEIHILRNDDGSPRIVRGQLPREHPFKGFEPV